MLKNFWYALAFTWEVTQEKPYKIKALGQDLVIYRDAEGKAHCLSDLCIHRGGALSDGWTKDNCIVCPYHGWEYTPEGECVKIPANLDGVPIPKKARVDAYPTEERYGWIWVFLGDLPEEERPPIPVLPGVDDPQYRRLEGEFIWNAHYTRVMENGMDFAHAPFVHGAAFGNPDEPEIPIFEVEEGPYHAVAVNYIKPTPSKGIWSRLYKKEPVPVKTTNGYWMPCIFRLQVKLPIGEMIIYDTNIPVDEYTTHTKWFMLRNFFTHPYFDKDSRRRTMRIFHQDQVTVEAQRPELLPYDLAAELHVKSDATQIAYRKMRNKYLDMGWGIDTHRIESDYTRVQATVIPSPARRENPEFADAWIMKEVPTVGRPLPPGHRLKRVGEGQITNKKKGK